MKRITEIEKVVQFVVDEVSRLEQLRNTDAKAANGEFGLSMGLPAEHGDFPRVHFQCGKHAGQKLFEVAAKFVEGDAELKGRIEAETYFRPLQVEIAQKCLIDKSAVTTALTERILQTAKAKAKDALLDRIYVFPVYGITADHLDDFTVGVASFVKTNLFFERFQDDWKRSVTLTVNEMASIGEPTDEQKKHVEWLRDSSREHYEKFRWVAMVEVQQAGPGVGWRTARKLLENSFHILRLQIPSREGQFIGCHDESPLLQTDARIERLPTGEFKAILTNQWIEPFVESGYLDRMRSFIPQVAFIEAVVRKQQNWQALESIETRLITSLSWFGEAWKERSAVPKIVKYAISLESLIMTGDREGLTELLAERLALLCGKDMAERKQLYDEVREVYRARSKAVHGDFFENDSTLAELNRTAEKLTTFALLSCSDIFHMFHGIKDQNKALSDFFTSLKLGGVQEALKAVQSAHGLGGQK
jgi:hypothetical protein